MASLAWPRSVWHAATSTIPRTLCSCARYKTTKRHPERLLCQGSTGGPHGRAHLCIAHCGLCATAVADDDAALVGLEHVAHKRQPDALFRLVGVGHVLHGNLHARPLQAALEPAVPVALRDGRAPCSRCGMRGAEGVGVFARARARAARRGGRKRGRGERSGSSRPQTHRGEGTRSTCAQQGSEPLPGTITTREVLDAAIAAAGSPRRFSRQPARCGLRRARPRRRGPGAPGR